MCKRCERDDAWNLVVAFAIMIGGILGLFLLAQLLIHFGSLS